MATAITISYHGLTASVRAWSDLLGVDYHTLLARIRRGWSVERAIESPVLHRGGGRRKHGMTGTQEYRAWQGMKFRCENPKNNRWHRYGGRGISVHRPWRDSFESFLRDVGPAPSPQHSLGRLDHDRGYEPGNVVWQSPEEQVATWKESQRREQVG